MTNKFLFFVLTVVFGIAHTHAQAIYLTDKGNSSIFSETSIENIDGHSNATQMALNTGTGDVFASVAITSYVFKKSLMQEHFNENYMESDKYPRAQFKGTVKEKIDYAKDGEYPVTLVGKFTCHGVVKDRTIPAKLTIKGNTIEVRTSFDVKLEDHKIDRPSIVAQQLADVIKVTIDGVMTPVKSK